MKQRRARAYLALIAVVLWTVGFEVVPMVHEATHDRLAPHVHLGDGSIVTVSYGGYHRHGDGPMHRDGGIGTDDERPGAGLDDSSPVPGARDHLTRRSLRDQLAHGAGSLAHHGAAVVPALAPPTDAAYFPRVIAMPTLAYRGSIASIDPLAATARGPPRG